MIIGDNPNFEEDRAGEYGRGNSHKLLMRLLADSGIEEPFYYTPVVKCRKGEKGKVSASQLKECKEYLQNELERVKPEYVITLGSTALKSVTNKAKITDLHGKMFEHKTGFKVLPTFHPAMSLRDPRFWDQINTDFRKFGKIINGISRPEHNIKVNVVNTHQKMLQALRSLRRSRVIAFDLETNGLQMRYSTSEIRITVLSTFTKNFVVDHTSFSREQLVKFHMAVNHLMRTGKKVVVAHNGKFDNLWLKYQYGFFFPISFDTMLASHLLDENSPNDLKYNARRYLDMDDWDIATNKKKGEEGFTEEQAEYAAADGYATIRLYKVFKEMLEKDPSLEYLYHNEVIPVGESYEVMESNGVDVDLKTMRRVSRTLDTKLKRCVRRMNSLHRKAVDSDAPEINWNSSNDLNRVLFEDLGLTPAGFTDGGAPSTAEDNLKRMKGQHEIIEALLEYREKFKMKSSFIDGWAKRLIDGKLYPGFKIHGTVTGRPSSSNPNLQQVPRNPLIRSLIGAPPGWVFFEADYSQVELRVAATLAQEPTMLHVFRTGGDIHESTYQMIMGMSTQEAVAHIIDPDARKAQLKEERKKAKAVNFGFIYGMGWKKFMEYCETKMDLKISASQAKAWRKRYFEVYSGLPEWHARQRRIVSSLKQVRTLTGRIRHLPQVDSPDTGLVAEAERQAINSPVQGFGAELILMSIAEATKFFKNSDVRFGGTVHDSMVGIVREGVAMECMKRLKSIMEDPKLLRDLGIELPLPLVADVSLGNWSVGKELSEEDFRDIGDYEEPDSRLLDVVYWYHPESDCYGSCPGYDFQDMLETLDGSSLIEVEPEEALGEMMV